MRKHCAIAGVVSLCSCLGLDLSQATKCRDNNDCVSGLCIDYSCVSVGTRTPEASGPDGSIDGGYVDDAKLDDVNLDAAANLDHEINDAQVSDSTALDAETADLQRDDVTYWGNSSQQQAYLKASNAQGVDRFGNAVAVSADGNTVVVGAAWESSASVDNPQDNSASSSGAVYVFARVGATWSEQAYLKASNIDVDDNFAYTIALSADGASLAVGAFGEASAATGIDGNQEDNTAAFAGAVYVFGRQGDSWLPQAYLKASNTDTYDLFGASLAFSADGNTLAVGASGEDSAANGVGGDEQDDSANSSGAAYVFVREGTTWSQQAYIKASNAEAGDEFGGALALSADGNCMAVGAVLESSHATDVDGDETDNSARGAGAVYIFTRLGSFWSQQAYVKASNTEADDYFGASLSLSADGSSLAVGAYQESSSATGINGDQQNNFAPCSGAVYMYRRQDSSWSPYAYIKASNGDGRDRFGVSTGLSADGTTLVVGAHGEDSTAAGINGDQNQGCAEYTGATYVFVEQNETWSQCAYVKASNPDEGDWFGRAVALSGDASTLIVGALEEDSRVTGINGDQNVDGFTMSVGAAYVVVR